MAADLKVVSLFETNYRNPATTLRKIADAIEAGKYGDVGSIGVALMGDTFEVFGCGKNSDGPSVAMLFHAGLMRLTSVAERHGRG